MVIIVDWDESTLLESGQRDILQSTSSRLVTNHLELPARKEDLYFNKIIVFFFIVDS